jgi:hypothetical protein
LLPNWPNFWPSFKLVVPAAVLEVVALAVAAVLVEAVALVAAEAGLCCPHYPPNDGDWIHPALTNFTVIHLFRF